MAIIGAASETGNAVAKGMAKTYRLLLMDHSRNDLSAFEAELKQQQADVEVINCCKEASWEADVVVVAVEKALLPEVAVKLKEVTNCKPVVHFIDDATENDHLQQALPHANVVSIWLSQPLQTAGDAAGAFLKGSDEEALQIAKEIMTQVGCY